MVGVATVPTDITNDRVMRAWYQSLRTNLEGVILNVRDFGAVGNSSTDDSDAFIRAVAYAEENHYSLYIPPGIFRVTKEIELTGPLTIFGVGPETSVIFPDFPATGGSVFKMTAGGDLTIRDIGFDGTDVTVQTLSENVYMIDVDPDSGTLENFNINNVKFSELTAFLGEFGTDATSSLRSTNCIKMTSVDKVFITNCHTDNVSGGFVEITVANDILIKNNKIKDVHWRPIHLGSTCRFFTIDGNSINIEDSRGSVLGGMIDCVEDVTRAIPDSANDTSRQFLHNGVIANNFLSGESSSGTIVNVTSMNGIVIKHNIINVSSVGSLAQESFLYSIHVGTSGASTTSFFGPPTNIIIDGNMVRGRDSGAVEDYGIRVDNEFQSGGVATARRPIENVIVKNNILGTHVYELGSTYPDLFLDKCISFNGLVGGIRNITCEDNTCYNISLNVSALDEKGSIDFQGHTLTDIYNVKIGGNRLFNTGTSTANTIVGINIGDYVVSVVNTKPNIFDNYYTAVRTSSTDITSLHNLDDQILENEGADPFIFGTELDTIHQTNISGTTANRPATGSNRTDYMMYFDTSIGYPVWFDGTNWITADGSLGVSKVQEITATGAVTAGVESIELNHISTVIEATIADLTDHLGLLVIKNTSASGTEAHTVTATSGTFDGTNNIATLDAPEEAIILYIDSAGNGTIVENIGGVGLST